MTIELRDMPDWPAALSFRETLLYSRLSVSQLRRAIRDGDLTFKPLGTNGRKIALRAHIDAYLHKLFVDSWVAVPMSEDMRFG
jgi:hypothetical protein